MAIYSRNSENARALRVREVADRLGLSHVTIRRYIQSGKIKAFTISAPQRLGGVEYRVLESDLAAFIGKEPNLVDIIRGVA